MPMSIYTICGILYPLVIIKISGEGVNSFLKQLINTLFNLIVNENNDATVSRNVTQRFKKVKNPSNSSYA